jgi:hypothetical protein
MKKFLFNTLAIVALVLVSVSLKAQPTITEYIAMKEPLKIDLSDKKIQKAMNAKGVLDLEWNEGKRTLAISYDPKMTNIQDALHYVKETFSNNMSASNNPGGFAKNEKE